MPVVNINYILPDEQHEYNLACNAGKLSAVVYEMHNFLRKIRKYEELTEEQYAIFHRIDQAFDEFLSDNDVSLSLII